MQDGILYKRVRAEYPNSIILPLIGNTDGTNIFRATSGSLWPLQIVQAFLPPNVRYMSENIILAGTHKGKMFTIANAEIVYFILCVIFSFCH